MEFTKHFNQMIDERSIDKEWVEKALEDPDRIENREDGTRHLIKQIPEYGNRWPRVVVNVETIPQRVVTAFFDRRLGREKR